MGGLKEGGFWWCGASEGLKLAWGEWHIA